MDYSNTNPVEVVENLSWHDKSPLAYRIFLKRHLNITIFVKKIIRTMIHSEHETYAAPEMELLELLMEQAIATSGDIDDYGNEDFNWD